LAELIQRHRIDGQVATVQIVFQRHIGRGVKGKAGVAATALAFGAGEGVFLLRLRMQEDGKVLANR
jgi:hypothetical protein